MKRAGNLMEQIVNLDNLYLAFQKASKGKHDKKDVRLFTACFDKNIQSVCKDLLEGTVVFGGYHYFTIHDPKERMICAAPFRERIIHHAVMNVCQPYFDRTLIDTTYATRKGKGVYAALDAAMKAMTHYTYSAKLDVRKYYDSIDHDVLKQKLGRLFKDVDLLTLFGQIIDSYSFSDGKGLPIGNLTSQYFANLYLSSLDHLAKEQWKVPVYIRYMDDILLASNDKSSLRQCVDNVCRYAEVYPKLIFKPPVFKNSKDGQLFLGYRVMPYRCLLSGRSKKRFRSKWLMYESLIDKGVWNEREYADHVLPLMAFATHAESKLFRKACFEILKGDSQGVDRTA